MKTTFLLSFILVAAGCAQQPADPDPAPISADARLEALYEREWAWRQAEDGRIEVSEGDWKPADYLPSVTAAAYAARLDYWQEALAELDGIPRDALSREGRINAAVFEQIVRSNVENVRYRTFEAPLNSDSFFWNGLAPQYSGFEDAAAYERYLSRMRDLPRHFGEHIENMRAGLERGYTPPAVTLRGRDASIEPYLAEGTENPFFGPFANFPGRIDEGTREALKKEAIDAINSAVVPAYRNLLAFMRGEYLPNARQTLAAKELPDGEAFYRAQIREYTTLDLEPGDIHDRGLAEVERIRAAMLDILAEVEFEGDLPAFFEFLRTDPQFYAETPEELMGVSAYVDKRMAAHLEDVLGFLPRKRHTIAPVPDAIAPIYTAGRGGYGRCWMNTFNLPARPLYTIPALTLHECSPGHSLQGAISREAPGEVPEFRARNYFSGYGEGWGLYTEWLGGELGIYRTPYERFGQLTYEMWRACRLVIDTGVHHFGWSRERALAYLRNNAALSDHEIVTEVDRYISWPGQALAYKLGEMLIREKRAKAEETLGTAFDQRWFHDKILSLRSVPLSVLGDELDRWIEEGGPNPYEGLDLD